MWQVDPWGLAWEAGEPRPRGWRLPKNGTWSGSPGHSDFKPSNPAALGLNANDVIPFQGGHPNFSQWSQGTFNVSNMTGDHSTDMPLIWRQIAEEKGFGSSNAARTWLSQENLTPHHAGGNSVELIPSKLHGDVRHTGSASEMRCSG